MLDVLYFVGFIVCGFLAPIFAILAWKIYKCPDSLWEELKRTPRGEDYEIIRRILK